MKKSIKNYEKLLQEALLLEAGARFERQERGIRNAINKIASKDNPITVVTSNDSIKGVIGAIKVEGLNELGKEPYADMQFLLSSGKRINISAKGSSTPSIAGGGLAGLSILVPNLINKFLNRTKDELEKKYKLGDEGLPDVFAKIPTKDSIKILKGVTAMGGPIDYMYQGPMDVVAEYPNKKQVVLNGELTNIEDYAKNHPLFLKARKRRVDQPFDPISLDASGNPLIFGKSPEFGDAGRRIVITDKITSTGIVIKL